VANSPAYYDTATITTVESFILPASSLTVTVITIFDQKKFTWSFNVPTLTGNLPILFLKIPNFYFLSPLAQ
jgi:hypothetical protein